MPGCDCVSPSFNIIQVAAVVGQFLLAPFQMPPRQLQRSEAVAGDQLVGPQWLALR